MNAAKKKSVIKKAFTNILNLSARNPTANLFIETIIIKSLSLSLSLPLPPSVSLSINCNFSVHWIEWIDYVFYEWCDSSSLHTHCTAFRWWRDRDTHTHIHWSIYSIWNDWVRSLSARKYVAVYPRCGQCITIVLIVFFFSCILVKSFNFIQ